MKATTKEREAMKYTQPKMCRVVDGGTGKARMVVEEPSQAWKDHMVGKILRGE